MLTLSLLKQYFQTRQVATSEAISSHFDEHPDLIERMLQHFIRRGQVKKKEFQSACSSCRGCDQGRAPLYLWCPNNKP